MRWTSGAAEQPAEPGEITRDVDRLRIDPHLDPASYPLQADLGVVGRPGDVLHQRSTPTGWTSSTAVSSRWRASSRSVRAAPKR